VPGLNCDKAGRWAVLSVLYEKQAFEILERGYFFRNKNNTEKELSL
jgi:hypothetical protein